MRLATRSGREGQDGGPGREHQEGGVGAEGATREVSATFLREATSTLCQPFLEEAGHGGRAPQLRRSGLARDFYEVLGVPKSASKAEINEAFRRIAVQYHPDRNRDEDAGQRFAEASEAYSVLSDYEKRHLYDTLGPDKYDDPREVLFYRLNQAAANREIEREYVKESSARQYSDAEGLGFMIFILLTIDFGIPSWVFGPWFYVFNAFLLLAITIGIYDQFKN